MKFQPLLLPLLCFSLLTGVCSVRAKSAVSATAGSRLIQNAPSLTRKVELFEQAATSVLNALDRSDKSHAQKSGAFFTQADITFIAKHWSLLSPSFRTRYQQVIAIPTDFQVYVSPSDRFEIYYTHEGEDSVSSTDTYGYGFNGNWRELVRGANGVPDYIDEVAWSFDSAWVMEVERFGFPAPEGFKSLQLNSQRYKVVVDKQWDNYYGITYVGEKISSRETGFRSHIRIRNEWQGWDINDIIDYESNPEKAVRITAAHEFFHAVQYGMIHEHTDEQLDYMPLSWIEGTAVLMEELGFDYVNDYTQYLSSFFNHPTDPLLDDTFDGLTEYKNSILAIYLYENMYEEPSISFIRDVFMSNYQHPASLDNLLEEASQNAGKSWSEVISSFFAQSYFTATRARQGLFIDEADSLNRWEYQPDSLETITRTIRPYGMQIFSYGRKSDSPDSLKLIIEAQGAGSPSWGIKAILLDDQRPDTIISIPQNGSDSLHYGIPRWSDYDSALVIIANTDPYNSLQTTVSFEKRAAELDLALFPNPVKSDEHLYFGGDVIRDISIYTLNGKLIAHTSHQQLGQSDAFIDTIINLADDTVADVIAWKVKNNAGKRIVSGTYIAFVGYRDEYDEVSHKRFKILVRP